MTLWKTTAIALVLAAAPSAAFACSWGMSKTAEATPPTSVEIGSAVVPNATPVDPSALALPVIAVDPEGEVEDDTAAE